MLPPGSTIGILGGGQLGRMLAMAAAELGMRCHIFAPEKDPPAAQVANYHTHADFCNIDALIKFAQSVDVITYEFENIPVEPLQIAMEFCHVRPSPKSLEITQDRLTEKTFIQKLGFHTAVFGPVDKEDDLSAAIFKTRLPAIAKTRRFGYDGKGQRKIHSHSHSYVINFFDTLENLNILEERPLIVEEFVNFTQEFAVVLVRGVNSDIRYFDAIATYHREGILWHAKCPSGLHHKLERYAQNVAVAIAEGLQHIGVLAVEFFLLDDASDGSNAKERILVNEIAPRVHNSGHLTRESCITDQFEQHIRAICGWQLGDTTRTADAEMFNLLGAAVNQWEEHAIEPDSRVSLYGKGEARPGRKMGHIVRLSPLSRQRIHRRSSRA